MTRILVHHLRELGVRVLILDEAQHLMHPKTGDFAYETADWLKSLANSGIALAIAGLPDASQAYHHNEQLARRSMGSDELLSFPWDGDQEESSWCKTLAGLVGRMGLADASYLLEEDVPHRLHFATEGYLGRLVDFLSLTVLEASIQGGGVVDRSTLIRAEQRRRDLNDPKWLNVFVLQSLHGYAPQPRDESRRTRIRRGERRLRQEDASSARKRPDMPLPLRVGRLREGESLLGFAARLGERNGWTSLGPFLNSLGLRFSTPEILPLCKRSAATLACAAAVAPTALERASYPSPAPGKVAFAGHTLHRWMVVTGIRRVCPTCLASDGTHRRLWDLAPVPVCAAHRTLLVASCPACRRDLRWTSTSATTCPCGQDLRKLRVASLDLRCISGAEAILARVEDRGLATAGLPPGLALPDLVPTLLRLGTMDAELVGAPQPTHLIRDASIVLDLLNLGLAALQPWPDSFLGFLARLAERAPLRGGRYGARRDFGAGTTWLSRARCAS